MKVIHYPADQGTNPYQKSLLDGLCSHGVDASARIDSDMALCKIAFYSDADILHLHWMYPKLVVRSLPIALLRFLFMHFNLLIWRLRGKKIVYTIHELINHEQRRVWLDTLNSKWISRAAARCIVHGPSAVPLVVDALGIPEHKISVIMHASYKHVLAATQLPDLSKARRQLLFFGLIRDYKGVPGLIKAFRACDLEADLLICGKPYDETVRHDVMQAANGATAVTLDLRFIPDDALQAAFDACHIIALPFTDVFTSGSIVMAISAGRPVVAPRIGLVGDYVDDSCAFLYDPAAPDGLANALRAAITSDQIAEKSRAALERATSLSEDKITAGLKALYEEILERAPSSDAAIRK